MFANKKQRDDILEVLYQLEELGVIFPMNLNNQKRVRKLER